MRFVLFLGLWVSVSWAAPRTAAPKQGGFNGSVEAGFALSGGPTGSQWLVDQIEWNQRFDASDRVHFFFNNSLSLFTPSSSPGTFNNSVNYFSDYRISGTGYTLANSGAYLEARFSDSVALSLGHLRVPFGLESQLTRFDTPTYFYSTAFTTAQNAGWLWDLGIQAEITRLIPGQLKLALLDGRKNAGDPGLALAARYEFTLETGAFSLIPSVAAYFGKFQGDPKDIGFSVGTEWLMGRASLNAEFIHAHLRSGAVSSTVYVEPSFDLGIAEVSLKGEWHNDALVDDINAAVAITKSLPERLRLRILYQAAGLLGNTRANQHDIRVLLGAHW